MSDLPTVVGKVLARKKTARGSYVGQNAFDASATVKASETRTSQVVIPQGILGERCFATAPMPRDEAATNMQSDASWGLVGLLREPYVRETAAALTPTVDAPYEQIFLFENLLFDVEEAIGFNSRTGAVFYRASRYRR